MNAPTIFKLSCRVLKDEQHTDIVREFHEKKHQSILIAYNNDKRQAAKMLKTFKQHGLVTKSWKWSCGLLKTTQPNYRRSWRQKNKVKTMQHSLKWIKKQLADNQY